MQDRDYQFLQIDRIWDYILQDKDICAQLPTGGGKTVEFTLLTQRYFRTFTDKSVLITVHRKELMAQAAKTIKEMLDIDACLITADTKHYKVSRVYIAMVGSLEARLHLLLSNIGLVIIDECHVANFNKIHEIFTEALILGFSATPVSTSKKKPLKDYYDVIVVGPQINELIALGFLSQNITRCPKDIVDSTKLEISRINGDYDEKKMSMEFRKPRFVGNVVKSYHKYCRGKKTIVFNVTIEHSKEVCEQFVLCGYNARHLASDNESERDEILKWFKETEDAILCNVMIATVGYDEPTVRNIILNFSTLSIVKFIQCSGRGGRVINEEWINKFHQDYPYEVQLKSSFNIIDLGGNTTRFGDWNDDRDWNRLFHYPGSPANGIAPKKTCPDCEGLVAASATLCTCLDSKGNACLHEFVRKKSLVEQDLEEMILITKGINIEDVIKKNSNKYSYYTFLNMATDVVKEMYMAHPEPEEHHKVKYFKAYYLLCIDWYKKTLANDTLSDITHDSWHIKRAKNNFNNLIEKYKNYPVVSI